MTTRQCPLGDDCDLTVAWMAGAEDVRQTYRAKLDEAAAREGLARIDADAQRARATAAEAETHELRAEVERLRAKLDAPGDMHWYALEPEGYLECWSTPIADNWDGPDHVYKLMAAHSRPDIFVTGEVKSLDDDGEPQDIEPVWFRTREEARGHFQRSLERLRAALGDAP
jgi:hypothetical protein